MLDDYDPQGKVVLLRLDLNVPVNDAGDVTDYTRIDRVRNTVLALHDKGAKIAILSHFGRPKGQVNDDYSLSFLPSVLTNRWGVDVGFCDDCTKAPDFSAHQVILMENTRFHRGEEDNTPEFVQSIAGGMADAFVMDAFSVAHRAHGSTEGLIHMLPSYAGLALAAELNALDQVLSDPKRPVTAIVGGAKISTKLAVLNNLLEKVDAIILGGGMANTFLYAAGCAMGKSLHESDMVAEAQSIMGKAEETGCALYLPLDGKAADEFKTGSAFDIVQMTAIPDDKMVLDIGPESARAINGILESSSTVLWNGPVGAFEIEPFDEGTIGIAKKLAALTQSGDCITVAGGGDTVAALSAAGVEGEMTYVSTAGGAFLEWLEGKELPVIAALDFDY